MAKRKRAIPQYGTVVLNGIEYYRTRVEDSDGNRFWARENKANATRRRFNAEENYKTLLKLYGRRAAEEVS